MIRNHVLRAHLLRSTFLGTRYRCLPAAVAALGLMVAAPTSSHAQAPPLGTAASYGVLAGATVTNVLGTPLAHTTINGNLGVSPGSACTGFDFGLVTVGCSATVGFGHVTGAVNVANAAALQAQADFFNAYTILAGLSATADMSGVDLAGKTLVAGVYSFSSTAQLNGTLTLNGQGNPNSVFIFNIGSDLNPSASQMNVVLINGAQAGHVFWRVGSSATLGVGSSFQGDILALTSITLDTAAKIICGAAWAHNGQVALDNNTITTCTTAAVSASSALPSSASADQFAVANAIDAFVRNGGTLPPGFLNLLSFLSPSQLAAAFSQLQGEAGTGAAQAGTQAMNSFLSLLTNPFGDNRGFAPERPQPQPIYKAPVYKALVEADPRRWSIWAAGYGNQSKAAGDPVVVGSHDRSASTLGYATGLDYRVTPYTVAGFALAGGGTRYGLSDGFGGGRSDMFQAAVYAITRVDAAYVSAALAYAWHRVSTDRVLTVAGSDHLTANFNANNLGGRIEGGYRFAVLDVFGWGQHGFTPYAAAQVQAFRTPSYSEAAAAGSSVFALSYAANTTTTTRSELGARFDWTIPVDLDTVVALRSRAAWAHDHWSDPSIAATFLALPGSSSFTVLGAAPARDLLLASAGAEVSFRSGLSLAGKFDSELAQHSRMYAGTARLSYTW